MRESLSRGWAEGEVDSLPSREPIAGLDSRTQRPWDQGLSWKQMLKWLSHPHTPVVISICEKNWSLPHLIFLEFSQKPFEHICGTYFWTPNSFVWIHVSILTLLTHCLDYSVGSLETSWWRSSMFVLCLENF